jgi:hypothetical protein
LPLISAPGGIVKSLPPATESSVAWSPEIAYEPEIEMVSVTRSSAIVALPVMASFAPVLNWAMSAAPGTTPNCQLAAVLKSYVPFEAPAHSRVAIGQPPSLGRALILDPRISPPGSLLGCYREAY